MPLYEYRKNAENGVTLSAGHLAEFLSGNEPIFSAIVERARDVKRAPARVAIDGWYGVDFDALAEGLTETAKASGVTVETVHSSTLYLPDHEIARYQKQYETEDPSFGWVNENGVIEDLMNEEAVQTLAKKLREHNSSADILVVYGPGAAITTLEKEYDLKVYADFTMQPMLWKMWGGELIPFGSSTPDRDYHWKKYYYCDFYLLYRQKKTAFGSMDLYIDAVDGKNLKMLGAGAYNAMIDSLVEQPIKQVKILQPGPWGAFRYHDLWEVEGLECNAWNELAGIELSILVDIGTQELINIPAQNVMQRPVQMVGIYVHKTYPDLMPLQVWLDDGYFPEPVSWERSSMPIHNHPGTDYVKRNFNEPLGRYETYYIVESYKGSSTWMGYKEGADLEEWERLCRDSDNRKVIPDWENYIRRWDSNVGDLFLIPPGTTHGHGGNQMILEMDTGPSVAGTEYSFFTYDFARNTWDDTEKTMTAKPMRMHLDHSFRNQKWIRENRVKDCHRARPLAIDGNGRFRKDRYATLPEMPFHIERIFMEDAAENDTEGKFMQIVTLTEGECITIESLRDPSRRTTIERLQACIVPAGFGPHRYINESGRHAMVVIIRLKKG